MSERSYPTREGRKSINCYLPTDWHRALTIYALDNDKSLQQVGEEAFEAYCRAKKLKVSPLPSR